MKKRIVSLALTLVLAFASVPAFAPPALAAGETGSAIAVGFHYVMAVKEDGSLWGWGSNQYGQFGTLDPNPDTGNYSYRVPTKLMDDVASVSAGDYSTAIVKRDGSLWKCGYDGRQGGAWRLIKITDNVAKVSMNTEDLLGRTDSTMMILKTDGSLWVAGGIPDNSIFGNGKKEVINHYNLTDPVKIMDGVADVSMGLTHVMVIKTDGSLWGWGGNFKEALGIGPYLGEESQRLQASAYYPTPIKIMDGVVKVSAGNVYTMAIKTDGSLWGWGSNYDGRVGDGRYDETLDTLMVPYPVKILDGVADVAAGSLHTLAVKTDGSLWAWGNNVGDALGNGVVFPYGVGTGENRYSSVPIKVMDGVVQVTSHRETSMAVKTDGSLWVWGNISQSYTGSDDPQKMLDGMKVPGPFDSAGDWAKEGLKSAVEKGFVPENIQNDYGKTITRAEFCRMAVKWVEVATGKTIDAVLAEQGKSRDPNAFTDVTNSDILAAAALGITSGVGNNRFDPGGQFTRQQAAAMILNTCKVIGANTESPPPSGFTDMHLADGWAHTGINFVRANGIMNGSDGRFNPKGIYTRQEAIVTFNNIDPAALP